MLLMVLVLFLITELPQGILAICSDLVPSFFNDYYVPLGDTMDIVALVNNGINFMLYCTMSRQFRLVFCQLFYRSHKNMATAILLTSVAPTVRSTFNNA